MKSDDDDDDHRAASVINRNIQILPENGTKQNKWKMDRFRVRKVGGINK